MKPRRWVIVVFACLLAATAGTVVGVRHLEKSRNIERVLVQRLSAATGGEFSVGRVRLGFFSVFLENISASLQTNSLNASVHDIEIAFSLWKLIATRGDFGRSISKIILFSPALEIRLAAGAFRRAGAVRFQRGRRHHAVGVQEFPGAIPARAQGNGVAQDRQGWRRGPGRGPFRTRVGRGPRRDARGEGDYCIEPQEPFRVGRVFQDRVPPPRVAPDRQGSHPAPHRPPRGKGDRGNPRRRVRVFVSRLGDRPNLRVERLAPHFPGNLFRCRVRCSHYVNRTFGGACQYHGARRFLFLRNPRDPPFGQRCMGCCRSGHRPERHGGTRGGNPTRSGFRAAQIVCKEPFRNGVGGGTVHKGEWRDADKIFRHGRRAQRV